MSLCEGSLRSGIEASQGEQGEGVNFTTQDPKGF